MDTMKRYYDEEAKKAAREASALRDQLDLERSLRITK